MSPKCLRSNYELYISEEDEWSGTTFSWWASMVSFSWLNILIFCFLFKQRIIIPNSSYGDILTCLTIPWVLECCWRSVFPCLYNQRQVLFDTPFSSPFLDRTLAACGEICMTAQQTLCLSRIALETHRDEKNPLPAFLSLIPKIMICFACFGEICSYTGMFTTSALFEVMEASFWTCIYIMGSGVGWYLLLTRYEIISRSKSKSAQVFLVYMAVWGLLYIPYMLVANIPMYWSRWRVDQSNHKHYLGIIDGARDSMECRVPTKKWEDWKDDSFWMTMYFGIGTWAPMLMMYSPPRTEIDPVNSISKLKQPLMP